VEIWRLDLFSYAGLVALAGAFLTADDVALWRLLGAWAAPTLGWLAAMYGGDFFDRDLDAVSKPQRPVPSGRVSAVEAFTGMVLSVVAGAVIATLLNPLNLVIVVITLAMGVSYSAFFKARGILGNLVRGGVTSMAFITGMLATGTAFQPELLPIALVFWLHDSGSNVVGAICDREGDRKGGYRTIPVRHGDTVALRLMLVLDVLWAALALGYPLTLGAGFALVPYYTVLAIALVMGTVSAGMLLRAPRPIPRLTSLRSHEILVIERLVLTSALVAAGTSAALAVALFVPSAAAALVASVAIMRSSYEPSRTGWRKRAAGHARVL
jgi:4-hydroxybenzoate polyprenyltransferase/geranylgeranylglycerol-phosphate geranylgeranyltransferase